MQILREEDPEATAQRSLFAEAIVILWSLQQYMAGL